MRFEMSLHFPLLHSRCQCLWWWGSGGVLPNEQRREWHSSVSQVWLIQRVTRQHPFVIQHMPARHTFESPGKTDTRASTQVKRRLRFVLIPDLQNAHVNCIPWHIPFSFDKRLTLIFLSRLSRSALIYSRSFSFAALPSQEAISWFLIKRAKAASARLSSISRSGLSADEARSTNSVKLPSATRDSLLPSEHPRQMCTCYSLCHALCQFLISRGMIQMLPWCLAVVRRESRVRSFSQFLFHISVNRRVSHELKFYCHVYCVFSSGRSKQQCFRLLQVFSLRFLLMYLWNHTFGRSNRWR